MAKRVILIGVGRVGRAIALDLAQRYEVIAVDISEPALAALRQEAPHIETIRLEKPQAVEKLPPSDLTIVAVPGHAGYRVLSSQLAAGRRVVDISFFPEDPYTLATLAQEKNTFAVIDAGVAPGLSNILLGYELTQHPIVRYVCYVGGLPVERPWPFQYRAPFSPIDVIEEYTRPVRQRIGGTLVIQPPLSEVELVEIPSVGILEAFNTDGLRTLLRNTTVPTLIEKTLRYPGHAEYMQLLAHAGFFSQSPVEVEGELVSPRQLTAALLAKSWNFQPGEKDRTIMRIDMDTTEGQRIQYLLIDEADPVRSISSMARTTGYTCAAVASWLIDHGEIPAGIYAPEELSAMPGFFPYLLDYLRERDVKLKRLM